MIPLPSRNFRGLLDDDESLAPSLLSSFTPSNGATPAAQGLLDMASMPSGPAQPPGMAAPPRAPAPQAAPPGRAGPGTDPLRTGVVAGGLQMLQDASTPSPVPQTVSSMIARALAAGAPAFIASKQAKEQRLAAQANEEAFRGMLEEAVGAKVLSPEQARLARQMGAEQGTKYVQEVYKERNAVHTVGNTAFRGSGAPILRDVDPTMTVEGAVYALDANGLPKMGADGKPLPPIIQANKPFDIGKIDDRTREALQVVLRRDPTKPEEFGKPLTEEEAQRVQAYNMRGRTSEADRSQTTIMGETAAAAAARGTIESFDAERKDIRGLRQDMVAAQRALDTVKNGIRTGSLVGARVGFGTLRRTLGLGSDETDDNTKLYMMQIADRVLPIVRTLAPVTEEDVALLTKVKGGDVSMSAPALQRFLEMQIEANAAQIGDYNDRVQRDEIIPQGAKNSYRVDLPEGYTPRGGGGGTTATGRVGERTVNLTKIGDKWYHVVGGTAYPYEGPVN